MEEKILAESRLKDFSKFREIMWIVTFLSNAAVLIIICILSGEYNSYSGSSNPYGSIFEYMMTDILMVFIFILFGINIILISFANFPGKYIRNNILKIADKRIFGINQNKEFDIEIDKIDSVVLKKSTLVIISKKTKYNFPVFENVNELYEILLSLTNLKKNIQKDPAEINTNVVETEVSSTPLSVCDDIAEKSVKKEKSIEEDIAFSQISEKLIELKKLLDNGTITQEEFEIIKKRLLNF